MVTFFNSLRRYLAGDISLAPCCRCSQIVLVVSFLRGKKAKILILEYSLIMICQVRSIIPKPLLSDGLMIVILCNHLLLRCSVLLIIRVTFINILVLCLDNDILFAQLHFANMNVPSQACSHCPCSFCVGISKE